MSVLSSCKVMLLLDSVEHVNLFPWTLDTHQGEITKLWRNWYITPSKAFSTLIGFVVERTKMDASTRSLLPSHTLEKIRYTQVTRGTLITISKNPDHPVSGYSKMESSTNTSIFCHWKTATQAVSADLTIYFWVGCGFFYNRNEERDSLKTNKSLI